MVFIDENCIDLTGDVTDVLPILPTPSPSSHILPISNPKKSELSKWWFFYQFYILIFIWFYLQIKFFDLEYITLVCFDKFKQPRKKLDGAIDIPYDLNNLTTFGQIEEEILSRNLPAGWGKIEIGLICYQKASNIKADHLT